MALYMHLGPFSKRVTVRLTPDWRAGRYVSGGFGLAEDAVNRIRNVITYVLAAIYFLVDAVFVAVAKPISNWIANHLALRKLRAWIRSLPPYPSLALFSVPRDHPLSNIATLITELLKLVLVERLFSSVSSAIS